MRSGKIWSWFWFCLGMLYFFIPLIATFIFSLKAKKDVLSFLAYQRVFQDPQFIHTFSFSLEMAILTIIAGLILIFPTAFWIHLKLPQFKPIAEIITLLPFVIPPIVLVFGLIRIYSRPPLLLTPSPILLIAGYVVLSFPYLYRAIDNGLQALDVRNLTEAAQSLGANWLTILFRVILPNLRVSLLSGAFLTFALVIGELTLAVMLAWPAFGPYMALVGRDLAYEPAALSIISFALTWGAIALIQFLSQGIPGQSSGQIGGTH